MTLEKLQRLFNRRVYIQRLAAGGLIHANKSIAGFTALNELRLRHSFDPLSHLVMEVNNYLSPGLRRTR